MFCRTLASAALVVWTSLIPASVAQETGGLRHLSALLDRSEFTAFSDEDEASAQAALLQALSTPPAGVASDDWAYLKTGDVSRAVESKADDRNEYLENLVAKLSQDRSPYENPGLIEIRRLTRHYATVLHNRQGRDEVSEDFRKTKKEVGEALARYERSGSPSDFARIAAGVRWLSEHEQANDFVTVARAGLSLPNLEIRLPAGLVRALTLGQRPLETEAVNRNSGGIQTVGTTEVGGQYYLEPTPATGGGLLSMHFLGTVRLSAANTRRKIHFNTNALTRVEAVGRIAIDDRPVITSELLGVNAVTGMANSRATVDQVLLRRPIGRLADRAIAKKTPEVEADLSREVSDAARAKLTTQLDEMTARANAFIRNDFLARALRLDLPPRFSVFTSEAELRLGLTEEAQGGLGAPTPPPAPGDGSGFAAIHESLATDFLNCVYVRGSRPPKVDVNSFQLLSEAVQELVPEGPFREAEIRDQDAVKLVVALDFPQPFRVAFRERTFSFTFRAKGLQLGDDEPLPAHDLTVDYRLGLNPDGVIVFTKQGEPRVTPRDPGRVAPPELVAAVRNELFANLRPAFVVELARLLKSSSPLPVDFRTLTADQGWLVGSVGVPSTGAAASPSSQSGE